MSRIAAVLVVVFLLFPTAAVADVDVSPNARAPRLSIEAKRIMPTLVPRHDSSSAASRDVAGSQSEESAPSFLRFQCPVDADVGTYGCRVGAPDDEEDEPEEDEERELTPGDVLRAVREMGMPALRVRVEPGDETLVNVETNFYTEPQPFSRSIELLGFAVDVQATPATYTWIHGDGTTARTTDPGSPYPDLDVTHRYREPSSGVSPRVDVTYQVRYRVDGGPWLPLSQTLIARGPASTLTVNEAAPVLTAP